MTELLKNYQDEIDLLTKRAKASEAAFGNLFKALFEVPDPVKTMQSMQQQLRSSSTSQVELARLRTELQQYEDEFRHLKNQDIRIRGLEEQLRRVSEEEESRVAEIVARRVMEAEARAEERIHEVLQQMEGFQREARDAREESESALISLERAQRQLLQLSTNADRAQADLVAQNTLLAESNGRLQTRLAELEMMALSSSSAGTGRGTGTRPLLEGREDVNSGSLVLRRYQEEESALRDALSASQSQARAAEESLRLERAKALEEAEQRSRQMGALQEEVSRLANELKSRPRVEDLVSVQQEMRTLQRLVFHVQGDEEDSESVGGVQGRVDTERGSKGAVVEASGGNIIEGERAVMRLEEVLGHRIRTLEAALMESRRSQREAEAARREAEEVVIPGLEVALAKQTLLVGRLEADLESFARGGATSGTLAMKKREGGKGRQGDDFSVMALSRALEDNSSISISSSGVTTSKTTTSAAQESGNMSAILQTQRDRYKEKLAVCEDECVSLRQQLAMAVQEKERLHRDNVELFSKMRYLQTFNSSNNNNNGSQQLPSFSVSASKDGGARSWDEERGGKDDEGSNGVYRDSVEIRYRSVYETRLNPFSRFSALEKQRKLSELSVAERLLLSTMSAVVSSPIGRSALLGYLALMHILVFFTLYFMAHKTHLECPPCSHTQSVINN